MAASVRMAWRRLWVAGMMGGAVLCAAPAAVAQEAPAANPADVESIDGIVQALYEAISGPRGQPRDWDRFHSLFIPEARMIPTGPDGDGYRYRAATPAEYEEMSGPRLMEVGFREHEIARIEERFGSVAHVWSTYEAFREGEETPFLRGVNSIQLFFDGDRWWVVTIFWMPETPDTPLPARYLPDGAGR